MIKDISFVFFISHHIQPAQPLPLPLLPPLKSTTQIRLISNRAEDYALSLSLCSLMQQVMQYNNADIDEDKDIEKSLHIFPKKHMKVILAMEMLLEMATDIIPIGLYYSIYMPIKKKKTNHHWQVSLISLFDRNVGAVKLGVDNKYVLVLGRTTYNIFHDNSSRSNVTSLPAA